MKQIIGARAAALALGLVLAGASSAAAPPPPPPLAAYGGLPGVEDMAISPSGKALAIIGRINNDRRLLVLDGERRVRVNAALGDIKLRYVRWAGEDMVVVVTSNTENLGPEFTKAKHEFYGATVVPIDGGKVQMVFGATPSMARAVFGDYGVRLVDGKWIGYFGGLELARSADGIGYRFDQGHPALFGVDLRTNQPHKIAYAAAESSSRDWLVDGSGNVQATLEINSATGRWQLTNTRGAVLASGVDPTGGVGLVSFGRDGVTAVYSLEDDASGVTRWFEVPLVGGVPREILANVKIDQVYVDSTNGRMLGYLEGGPSPTPVLFDPAQQELVRRVYRAFPKLDLRIVQFTPDFSHFLVHTSGNRDSGTWYLVDMATRRADPVGNDYPLVAPDQVGAISTVAYRAGDGTELDGVLTLPPDRPAKNLPVIMLPHGGPQSFDTAEFDWWAQAFASRGYAVFQPNFRGSTNRDDAFRRAGYGQWGRKMQTDISDGLAELAKQGIVDPTRACIVGASYGGYAALAGVTLQHGLYRCAVAVAPVSDLGDMYWTDYRESGDNKMIRQALQESLGQTHDFAAVSPRRHAAAADAPIMLIHGKDDTVVPFRQSSAMADALKDANKPYELVVMPEEDHWLSHAATRRQMLDAAMRFVTHYNPTS
jgi:dipeptidyl aminopeptidase/acylaminoacyl peptidase